MPTESENTGDALADVAIDWLVLMRSGSVSAEACQAFERWLREDAAHRRAFAEAEALWGSAAQALKDAPSPVPQRRPNPHKTGATRRRAWNPGLAVAATLLLSVAVAWSSLSHRLLGDYSTRAGEQKQVVLADGSRVLLNTDTAIALDWSAGRRRIVLLKGQAEFTVAQDAGRPFDVEAGNVSVRALGTVFDVYEQASGAVDVSVSEHAVAVSLLDAAGADARRVEQGQQLHYEGHGQLAPSQSANLHQLDAWKRGKLIFRDQPLADVIAELNRYSPARIVLKGDGIGQLRVSGVFPIDGMEVLEALEKSFALRALHLGPWLVILHG